MYPITYFISDEIIYLISLWSKHMIPYIIPFFILSHTIFSQSNMTLVHFRILMLKSFHKVI